MYASRFLAFVPQFFLSELSGGCTAFIAAHLSRAGREDGSQQAGAMVPEALGA